MSAGDLAVMLAEKVVAALEKKGPEKAAAKTALQEAAFDLAERLLPKLAM